METLYNRIAGQNLERLGALSDGVFAFAMTLLVVDLKLPELAAIHSEHDLRSALGALMPRLVMAMMSFLTLGIFWSGQQTQLNYLKQANRDLSWLHLAFLFAVTLVPFSTQLLAEFLLYRTTLIIYWLNILLLGAVLYASWSYASRHDLIAEDTPAEVRVALRHRVLIAQALYAAGALLCVVDTRVSLGVILIAQLNYAIAPKLRLKRAN